jgi:hypothetical protein
MKYLNNMYKLLLFLSLEKLILSFIKLPLFTYHSSPPNKTYEDSYFKYFSENNIYTYLNIGSPSQKIAATLNFNDNKFYIYNNRCELISFFNINESNSYSITPNGNLFTDIYAYTYLVNDTFSLDINKNTNNILTYLFSPLNKDKTEKSLQISPYTCAQIGLKLSNPEDKSYKYNFIIEIKKANLIDDYTFFVEYDKNDEEKGNLIIGIKPYEYDNKKYKYIQLKEIYSDKDSGQYWGIKFDLIYSKKIEGNDTEYTNCSFSELNAGLDHNLNVIYATEEYRDFIEKYFLKEKIDKKLCQKNYLKNNKINYECNNLEDIKQFPTLYLYRRNLGYTFELDYNDIFTEYNGKYISLIWIDMSSRKNWVLGKPFLKKYFFYFSLEKKIIGFFNQNIKENENESNDKFKNFLYISLILLLLIIIGVLGYFMAKVIYKYRNSRQKGDELIDEDEDEDINE